MDSRDRVPVALALYAASALVACAWSGFGVVIYGVFFAVDLLAGGTREPVALVFGGAFVLFGLVRLVGGLATVVLAGMAAWRGRGGGDADLVRPAGLAAAAMSLLGLLGSVCTFDCCAAGMWVVSGVCALVAVALTRRDDPSAAHPGWGGEP